MNTHVLPHAIPADCRGIIVADRFVLENLDTVISNKHLNPDVPDRPRRYIDLLQSLAQEGYFIVIPEMVLFECIETTTKKIPASHYFPSQPGVKKKSRITVAEQFLGRVLNGKIPNIAIWPSDENSTSEPAQWVQEFNEFVRKHPEITADNNDAMQELQAKIKSHFTQVAAFETCEEILRNHSAPVYFLSDDPDNLKKFAQTVERKFHGKASHLSGYGLFMAVVDSSLALRIGFASPIYSEMFSKDHAIHRPEKGRIKFTLQDSAEPEVLYRKFMATDRPFFHSLKRVVAQMPPLRIEIAPPLPPAQPLPTQREKFGKWGDWKKNVLPPKNDDPIGGPGG